VGPVLLAIIILSGCDDPFAGFLLPVPDEPVEEVLIDFRIAGLLDYTAFDVVRVRTVRIDQTGEWDFMLLTTEAGVPQLAVFGAVAERTSEAGLMRVSSFEGLLEAPEEGYTHDAALDIEVGDVFAVVSHRDPGITGRCRHYAKIEILDIDPDENQMTFKHLINPNCEDRILEPGQHGDF